MIEALELINLLGERVINLYTGVPDSLLKEFCYALQSKNLQLKHLISANEGTAVASAAGNHLATNKIPLVYLQNSGLGNIINPIISLTHKKVYSIPIFHLIGWRGEPGQVDEPQHLAQGEKTEQILNSLDIPYITLSQEQDNFELQLSSFLNKHNHKKKQLAILVRNNTFDKNINAKNLSKSNLTSRSCQSSVRFILMSHK